MLDLHVAGKLAFTQQTEKEAYILRIVILTL
jgi:hypothetical protein